MKIVLNIFRASMLLSAIIAIATWVVFYQHPKLIDKIDKKIVASYVSHYGDKYNIIGKKLETNKTVAIHDLENLLEDLSYVKKGDRLDSLKRLCMSTLIQEKIKIDDYDTANRLFEEYMEFDDRDFKQKALYAEFLFNYGDKQKALKTAENMYQIAPFGFIETVYLSLLTYMGREVEAVHKFYMTHGKKDNFASQKWQVFWDQGYGYNATDSKEVTLEAKGDNIYEIKLYLPKDEAIMKSLRLDPPAGSNIKIDNWQITFGSAGRDLTYSQGKIALSCNNQVTHTPNSSSMLTNGGDDPQCVFTPPAIIPMKSNVYISIKSQITENLPIAIKQILQNPNRFYRLLQQLNAKGYNDEAQYLSQSQAKVQVE